MSRKSVLIQSVAAGLFVAAACSSDESSTPNDESNNPPGGTPGAGTDARTGSIQFALQVAPGVEVDTINYQISGPGMSTMTGSMDAGDGVGDTFVAALNGVPPGAERHVLLTANASNGATCSGDATAEVVADQTTMVTIVLLCRDHNGTIGINGSFDQCPLIKSVIAAPASAPVGGSISVSVVASDADGDSLMTAWTATAGSFEDPAAASTHYVCSSAGMQMLTATATDPDGCDDSVSVQVTCTPGAGQCDNGVIDAGEMCDGTNLNGETCASITMNAAPNGVLACSPDCTFDTSGCQGAPPADGGGGTAGMGGAAGTPDAGTAGGGGTL